MEKCRSKWEEKGDKGELCRSTNWRVKGELKKKPTTVLIGDEKDEQVNYSTIHAAVP